MRIFILMFGLLCSQHATAQRTEDTLRNLSIAWMKALEQKDKPALERFLAKEYTLSSIGDAYYVDRATWMKNAIDKTWGNTSYKFKGVQIDGNQAIVNSVMSFTVKPVPFIMKSEILDHWVFRDGRWQVRTRYLGGDSITNFFQAFKGYLIGVAMILIVLWLRRYEKKRKQV